MNIHENGLAIRVGRSLKSQDVLNQLSDLFLQGRIPAFIRSDNGPEFRAMVVRNWLKRLKIETLFIKPGSPWENRYNESFNGKLRDDLLNGELFDTLNEAQIIIEQWRKHYNQVRTHKYIRVSSPSTGSHPARNLADSFKTSPEGGMKIGGRSTPLIRISNLL